MEKDWENRYHSLLVRNGDLERENEGLAVDLAYVKMRIKELSNQQLLQNQIIHQQLETANMEKHRLEAEIISLREKLRSLGHADQLGD